MFKISLYYPCRVKRFVFLSLYEQNAWKVTHVSRKSTRMWLTIGERSLESLHLLLPFHGLFPSANAGADASASRGRGECVWGQRRMRLGAEADASGGRGGRVWGQRRMQTGRSSLTSWEFVFTRHRGGVPAASLVCVASSLSAPFGKRIQTVKRRICIPIEHFKYNANWEQSIKHKFA